MLDWSRRYHDLENGRTKNVEWAGHYLRLRVRPGRRGSKLELSASTGSRVVSLLFIGFLGLHWLFFVGGAVAYFVGTTRAELPDFATVGAAAIFVLLVNLFYMPFIVGFVERDWSFEPQVAVERLTVVGLPFRTNTHEVIGASEAPDRLILRTADYREVVVRPGWGTETDEEKIPPELSRVIQAYLGVAPGSQMSTRMGTR